MKIRLDDLLVELGFFPSKEKARTCIMMNGVELAGKLENKAGKQINKEKFFIDFENSPEHLKVDDKLLPYVSRGAFKLEEAYNKFSISFKEKIVLDIGASTGGFTDFALEKGALRVIALDVGTNQLAYKLRSDTRVLSLENTNFRTWQPSKEIQNLGIDIVVTDVSFISLVTILQSLKILKSDYPLLFKQELDIVALLKPQFEAGKEIADKFKGIIDDEKTRREIFHRTLTKISDLGYELKASCDSPIKGAKGNLEYLIMLLDRS